MAFDSQTVSGADFNPYEIYRGVQSLPSRTKNLRRVLPPGHTQALSPP